MNTVNVQVLPSEMPGINIPILTAEERQRASAVFDHIETRLSNGEVNRTKSLLRESNLPLLHEGRGKLWVKLCNGSTERSEKSVYQLYTSEFARALMHHQALPVTGLSAEMCTHHLLNESGIRSCRRVLYCLAESHPQIRRFSPMLYALAGLLLHYMNEEDCFDCIYALLKRKDTNYFLAPSELSIVASQHVLHDLTCKYAKRTAHTLGKIYGGSFLPFLKDWVLWIFKHLPLQYLVHIVDCYLMEGFKVLYRVAIALVVLFQKHQVKDQTNMESAKLGAEMKRFCEQLHQFSSCQVLLKIAFGIRGFSKREIGLLSKQKEALLKQHGYTESPSPRDSLSDHCEVSPLPLNGHTPHGNGNSGFKMRPGLHTHMKLHDINSTNLEQRQLSKVWSWLPAALAIAETHLIFTTNEHGYSLKTFYEKVDNRGPVVIIIKTINNDVFGAFCSEDWKGRNANIDTGGYINFFGNGLSFVFRLKDKELVAYPWVGRNQEFTSSACSMFQAGDKSMFMIGGGGACAIQIDASLDHGTTERCNTFENEPLATAKQFRIQQLEVFAFE